MCLRGRSRLSDCKTWASKLVASVVLYYVISRNTITPHKQLAMIRLFDLLILERLTALLNLYYVKSII